MIEKYSNEEIESQILEKNGVFLCDLEKWFLSNSNLDGKNFIEGDGRGYINSHRLEEPFNGCIFSHDLHGKAKDRVTLLNLIGKMDEYVVHN
jgi:hypothetical protein